MVGASGTGLSRRTSIISVSHSIVAQLNSTVNNGDQFSDDDTYGDTSEVGYNGKTSSEAYWIALSIYEGTFDEISYKEYANYLGNEDNRDVLNEFVGFLYPLPSTLLHALERISSRLYFIAEAQNIDRILEALSIHFSKSGSSKQEWTKHYKWCHIVLFSLLLLNSDLHNEEAKSGSQSKFSCKLFVDNTIYALKKEAEKTGDNLSIYESAIANHLTEEYNALKYNPLPLFTKQETSKAKKKTLSHSSSAAHSARPKRSSTVSSRQSKSPSMTSLHSNFSHTTTATSTRKESHTTSNWKFHHNVQLQLLYLKESFDSEFLKENHTLWLMDGLIHVAERNMKQLNRSQSTSYVGQASQKLKKSPKVLFHWITKSGSSSENRGAKQSDGSRRTTIFEESTSPVAMFSQSSTWVRAKVRITEGRIFVFKLKHIPNLKLPACSSGKNNEDLEKFKAISTEYSVYNLFEALAELVQENVVIGTNKGKNNIVSGRGNFTVTIPIGLNGSKVTMEFQTDTVDEAQLYVHAINFWAARVTPVPSAQFEIVSNDEYGWSDKILSKSKVNKNHLNSSLVSVWNPLLSLDLLYNEFDNIADQTQLTTRMTELQEFTQHLEKLIENHNSAKPKMISIWQETFHFEKVMDNWNKRYLYLNKQYEKTSIYQKSLEMASTVL